MPIKALNNYVRDWVVKARVASRVFKETTRNGGALLKIELVDMYGTSIEGTFFKKSAEKFGQIIEEGKIYLFSDGNIKLANKKYTSVPNDFSITFEEHSRITEAKDDKTITQVAFNFTTIEKIQHIQKYKSVDIVAVILDCQEKENVNTRSSTTPRVRSMFTLMDDS